jgi:magnesium chelatase family protein
MNVKTFFQSHGKIETGFVEVKLLPGIPQLHIVGLPDASIRECGIKLKSALRSLGLDWPAGRQIVVSLRPMDFKKSGSGVDLPIALAYLAATGQLSKEILELLKDHAVYGEIALNGEVHAPGDLAQVLSVTEMGVLTGQLQSTVREGRWREIKMLNQASAGQRSENFDWSEHWQRPRLPNFLFPEVAAKHLILSAHMGLNVLLAGPQGTGKTTWARILHALMPPPNSEKTKTLISYFGEEILQSRWAPLEQPHHTITPQAMIGGGLPPQPGVITRAHGGVLLMDEFLHFHPQVLESLREPIESGYVEIARKGSRQKFPADFQLVATTNLCPCGKMNPLKCNRHCPLGLVRCRSTIFRLSGPILDRFDLLSLTHDWTGSGPRMSLEEILRQVEGARQFAISRPVGEPGNQDWMLECDLSHRRRNSIARVARGIADLARSAIVEPHHVSEAFDMVVTPMRKLREIFG